MHSQYLFFSLGFCLSILIFELLEIYLILRYSTVQVEYLNICLCCYLVLILLLLLFVVVVEDMGYLCLMFDVKVLLIFNLLYMCLFLELVGAFMLVFGLQSIVQCIEGHGCFLICGVTTFADLLSLLSNHWLEKLNFSFSSKSSLNFPIFN